MWKSSACTRNAVLILRMCEEGYSLAKIGKAAKTNPRHVKSFLRRNGVTKEFPNCSRGQNYAGWKGVERIIDKDGYVLIYAPSHPNRRKSTPYVLEHRFVMEVALGRYLLKNEVVHHRNKDKQDNRIENLQLFSENSQHLRSELSGRCPKWSAKGKARIQKLIARNAAKRRGQIRVPLEPDAPQSKQKMFRFVTPPEKASPSPSGKAR
jgi:hypothetical protein